MKKPVLKSPITPKATPITPKATPITPKATPITPKATPITPKAKAAIPDPTSEVNEVLSPADEATKLAWWNGLSVAQQHLVLKQSNSIFSAADVEHGEGDRVTQTWRLFQAGRITL